MNLAAKVDIKGVLDALKVKDYYAASIPVKMERNARDAFRLPPEEEVLAIIDMAIIRKGRAGLLFTDKGIYWKYVGSLAIIPWEQLGSVKSIQVVENERSVRLEGHPLIQLLHSESLLQVAMILRELRDLVVKHGIAEPPYEEDEDLSEQGSAADRYADLSRDQIIQKIVQQAGSGAFLPPFQDKLNALLSQRFAIPADETILAFLDFGIYAPGKDGVLLTSRGIYWRSKLRGLCYTWEDLYAAPHLTLPEKSELSIDGQRLRSIAGRIGLTNTGIRDILQKIINQRSKDQQVLQAPVLPLTGFGTLTDEEKGRTFDRHVIASIARKRATSDVRLKILPFNEAVLEQLEEDYDLVASTTEAGDRFARGITLTSKGVYLTDSVYTGASREESFVPYARLNSALLTLEAEKRLYVNSWLIYESSYVPDIFNLLKDLQAYILSLEAEDSPEMYEKEAMYMDIWPIPVTGSTKAKRWVVAEDKVIRGVWDEFELQHGLDNGIIQPDNLDVWSEGMQRWVPMTECSLMK